MTQKESGMQMVIEAQEDLINELVKEVRRIKLKNIRINKHMKILAGVPRSKTADQIRSAASYAGNGEILSESIIHLN